MTYKAPYGDWDILFSSPSRTEEKREINQQAYEAYLIERARQQARDESDDD